jgi:hypothetical protein
MKNRPDHECIELLSNLGVINYSTEMDVDRVECLGIGKANTGETIPRR